MSNCQLIKRSHRKICDGAMQTSIDIYSRTLAPSLTATADPTEIFVLVDTVSAMVDSTRGVSVFDETNVERAVTHTIYVRFIDFLTQEYWIKIPDDNVIFDILNIEDLDYRHEYQKLLCNQRGVDSAAANEG